MKHTIESIRKDINEYVEQKGITLKDIYIGAGLPTNPDGTQGNPVAVIFERSNNEQYVMAWELESMDYAIEVLSAFEDIKPGREQFMQEGEKDE